MSPGIPVSLATSLKGHVSGNSCRNPGSGRRSGAGTDNPPSFSVRRTSGEYTSPEKVTIGSG